MTADTEAPFLDIFQPGFSFEDPLAAQIRDESWYARTPRGIVVLRHREASELLRDRRLVKGPERYMAWHGVTEGPLYDWWTTMLSSRAPADHARLRGLVNKAFTPRAVESLRRFMRATADQLAEQIVPEKTCEFVAAFADPLPAYVMCALLGVPVEDYDVFHRCSTGIGLAYSRDLSTDLATVEAALVALSDYVGPLIANRRKNLGDDLLSRLIQVEEDGERLSPEELHSLVLLLVWAGQDTTARQIGRTVITFAEHPDQWELLARRPELAMRAMDEVLRWSPQSRSMIRFAAQDFEYQGVTIAEGEMVSLCVVTANRDPLAFDNAEQFDITAEREAKQLAFSAGIHYCLGVSVARLEMAEGFVSLTQRFGPPSVAGPITWRPPVALLQGPDVLPLRFAARR